ncbi:hypothetical protein TTRE_0000674401 [Trichuris trichiura]|uniref:Uncharacterized protein n=1 Tax=Trichuris trichiura TaxID=36087 RepID=A0A077ZIK2_TRITR|nr:hypothetical protein TTRE_0000674401 [Trichuris trichiura]
MDKSPDRLSDCSVMTEDSYRTARFEASDDDSITKTNSCQRLYFTTVLENDVTATLCTSEAETFCLEDSIEGKESDNVTEENVSLNPQQIAVVKPTFPGTDKLFRTVTDDELGVACKSSNMEAIMSASLEVTSSMDVRHRKAADQLVALDVDG